MARHMEHLFLALQELPKYGPKYSEIAKAYGAEGIKIKTAMNFFLPLLKYIKNGKPTVVDVPMINNPTPTTGHWNI